MRDLRFAQQTQVHFIRACRGAPGIRWPISLINLFNESLLGDNSSPMLELEVAIEQILAAMPAPHAETVTLAEAHDRVLAETMHAACDLPSFDNSAMDGYAVRAADVATAGGQHPVRLRLQGRVAAGEMFPGNIGPGECVRIFTGSPMPAGADAVVMQEDARPLEGNTEEILICDSVRPGESIRRRGEDIATGKQLACVGANFSPGIISLLAATGVSTVRVNRQPVVGLIATGSELREPGEAMSPGQIYESNRAALTPLIRSAGARPRVFPIVPDTLADTQAALDRAFASCDMVATSGGASVGDMDFVKAAFEKLGGRLEFWKVAMRPGKPFVFGRLGEKFLFGLPGNPVSAFITYLLLVRPAMRQWQGALDIALPWQSAPLGEPLINRGDRRHFMRVKLDEAGNVFSAGQQSSHALASLASATGIVDVPAGVTLETGAAVKVCRWT